MYNFYCETAKKQITAPKRATPSIKADRIIAVVLMSPVASGCRAIASDAFPPIFPMPIPTPMAVSPAPIPAPSAPILLISSKINPSNIILKVFVVLKKKKKKINDPLLPMLDLRKELKEE